VHALYAAVVNERPPAHGGRWGKANLDVCLAVLASARAGQEVFLSYQTATLDAAPLRGERQKQGGT